MQRIAAILIVLIFNMPVSGQDTLTLIDSLEYYKERPKIGLALSGGAAHGLAHIGVIQYLDEIGIDVDYVTGTSMGAIIGALYAMGYDGEKIEQIAKELDWRAILNNKISLNGVAAVEKSYHDKYPLTFVIDNKSILLPQGFLNTNMLELELAKLFAPACEIENFEELPRAFNAFGVDIEKGEIVTLRNGRLAKALRASMAIPSVFAPKYYQGKHLVDGGLMRNFPVSDNIEMGSDFVIGSYVGREKADITGLRTLIDILTESAFMMSINDSKRQKALSNVLISPDVKAMGVFDFANYEEFIEEGYKAAEANEERLLELAAVLNKYPREKTKCLDDPGFVFIDSIKINEMPVRDQKLVFDKLALKERSYMTFEHIEDGINRVTSTLNFESVSYDVVRNGSGHFLYVEAEPREEKKIGININHFTPTNSSLIINAQVRNFLFRLSNLRATIRLSENAAIGGEFFVRGGLSNKNWVFGMRVEAQRQDMIFESSGRQRKNGLLWKGFITPYLTYEFNNFTSIRAEIDIKRYDFINEVQSEFDIDRFVEVGTKTGVIFSIDDRDSRIMTRRGLYLYARTAYGFETSNNLKYTNFEAADVLSFPIADNFFEGEFFVSQTIPVSKKVWWTFMGDAYYKSSPSILDNYSIGGTTVEGRRNLPFMGFREQELRTDQHLYVRSDIRIGIFENVSVALVGNIVVGESKSFRYSHPKRDDTFTAYGIGFEFGIMLPIGPVIFDVGYNSEARNVRTELSIGWKHFF